MTKRLIQILLVVSMMCGASAQAFSCVSMMQSGNHACCRMVVSKQAAQKMRASHSSHQTPAKSLPCCNVNTSRPQQPPAEQRSLGRNESAIIVNSTGIVATPAKKEVLSPVKLSAPSGYSPPHFILYQSLLI